MDKDKYRLLTQAEMEAHAAQVLSEFEDSRPEDFDNSMEEYIPSESDTEENADNFKNERRFKCFRL